jgi:hypothetical protein
MSRSQGFMLLTGLLAAGLAGPGRAAGPSGCVTCHLDEAALTKSLAKVTTKKSALQSGQG